MMKKLLSSSLLLVSALTLADNGKSNWTSGVENKAFIENQGQFGDVGKNKTLYAYDNSGTKVYFSQYGITYALFVREVKEGENEHEHEREFAGISSPEEWIKKEREEHARAIKKDRVSMTWEGCNPNAEIVAGEKHQDYYSYAFKQNGEVRNINYIPAYSKLTYKNIYPGIDVEYTFHPEGGLKYSFIVHPGADPSVIKMKFSDGKKVWIKPNGDLHIKTEFGDIIDHAPMSFYQYNNSSTVNSSFDLTDNTVSFKIGNYNSAQTLVIDPWVQTPTLTNSNAVWECEKDGTGNVYIIGGEVPMRLRKYNNAGAVQWTYNTPWDTTNDGDWIGTMATDLNGITYVTNGSTAELEKISTAGAMIYHVNGGGLDEYWNIAFNCDQTRLIIGGTRLTFNGLSPNGSGVIFDINTNTGAVSSMITVGKCRPGFLGLNDPEEVRSITSSYNARYYFLTLDTIGYIDQGFGACPSNGGLGFRINDNFAFGYKSENWRPQNGNGGIMAIRANKNYVYTNNGTTIQRRSLQTGAVINQAAIPGGLNTTSLGKNQPGNSGIDIDSCGNVYVGSGNQVVKYDAALNLLSSVATSYKVYDVCVSYGGEVIACGATGTSSTVSRTGYVEQMSMGACYPRLLACCNANICNAGPFCVSDPSYTLTPGTAGGVWSGTGVNASGVFSPSTAGVGVHAIVYTLPCGNDTSYITVNSCAAINVCINSGTLTASGGTGTYTWSTQTTTANCTSCIIGCTFPPGCSVAVTSWTPAATGTATYVPSSYPVLVQDGAGTTYTITNSTSVPNCTVSCTTPTVSPTAVNNVTCAGAANGSATVTAVPAGTYTYTWFPGSLNGSSQSGLSPGQYTVQASSGGSCTGTTLVNITQPPIIDATPQTASVTCFGGTNGSATLTISGGTPGYTVTWSSGGTGNPKTGLSPGTHTATINDANGCIKTVTLTIGAPTDIVTTQTVTAASCGSSNGSAVVNATGGTGVITYSWSTGATGSTLSGVPGGTYTVTATDANGCTDVVPVTIGSAGGPSATAVQTTSVTCFGGTNGTATVSISGGTPGYTVTSSSGSVAGTTINNLPAGTHTATITDANNCVTTTTVTVSGPTDIVTTQTVTASTCGTANGSATVNSTGGTGVITYSWSTGATGATLSGVNAGTYTVTSTDGNGCTDVTSVTIGNTGAPTATAAQTASVTCFGLSNGTATVNISGGTPGYTVTSTSGSVSGTTINNLPAGTFTATVTDANNCITTTTLTINEPADIVTSSTVTPATCGSLNGSATVSSTGGSGVITYSWSTGATGATLSGVSGGSYSVVATDGNGCTDTIPVTITSTGGPTASAAETASVTCNLGSNGTASVSISGGTPGYTVTSGTGTVSGTNVNNLPAGTYTFTISDANSCVSTATVTITEPPAIVVTFTDNSPSACAVNTGSVTANATGGTGVMTYSWSTGATGATLTNVGAGTYTVTATDANNCPQTGTVSIGLANTPTATPVATASVGCNGASTGSASVTITGGTPSYTVTWSGGGSGTTITGQPAGTQTVTVTDAGGCVTTGTVNISEATAITSTVTGSPSGCVLATGSATVTAGGGTPTYTYTWSNSQTGNTATGLSAGVYTVTITDANGCPATNTVSIGITNAPVMTVTTTSIACNGASTGSASASSTGGTPTYTYTWSNSTTGSSANGLPQGSYSVVVTDAGGCTDTTFFTITEPTPITETFTNVTDENCNLQNGAATVNPSGGTPGYTYQWSSGGTNATATGLATGTHTVIITDANGCTDTATVNVANIPGPTLALAGQTNVSCSGLSDGSATVTPTGGTPGYTYSWTGSGSTSATASGLATGFYTATVTDAAGCTSTQTVAILQPTAVVLSTTVTAAGCAGSSTGSASAAAAGGTPGYNYSWSNGQTGANATGLAAGVYTVTATDANSCPSASVITITDNPPVDTLNFTGSMCVNDLTITLTAPHGGVAPDTMGSPYQWYQNNNPITGASSYIYNGSTASISFYSVTWYLNGCRYTTTANYILVAQDMGTLNQTNVFTPNDDKINDEFIPFYIGNLGPTANQLLDANIDDYDLNVYDRWGVLLFHSTSVLDMWDGKTADGKEVPTGTYFWIAKYKAKCSKITEEQSIKGYVQLIR